MRTALITGAGRGIGLATAGHCIEARQFDEVIAGERLDFDLRNLAGIPALVASIGEIDTLVNKAGVLYCDPLDAIPTEHKREILAVNLEAPAELIACLAPQMKARRNGRVVSVAPVSAFTGHPDL